MASVRSLVAVVKTKPESVLEDYGRVMRLAGYQNTLSPVRRHAAQAESLLDQYFPACSTEPWQLEGVVRTLLEDGYAREKLFPVENKTVVTNPRKGCQNNLWEPILERYGLTFQPLPEVEWVVYKFQSPLLKLNDIFPEGIEIPEDVRRQEHPPLSDGQDARPLDHHGAIKNAFGGLLKEVRHYAHKYIHEVMVDLVMMQKEIHPGVFAVMDGTVAGDGAGPRTMFPRVKNYILASADSVAIDAIAAKMMGFAPLEIPYLRMCHERGLGVADPREIEVVGEDVSGVNFGFQTKKSFVIWGDQMLRKGPLRFLEKVALHSPLVVWAPMASNVYHDSLWYPTIGQQRHPRVRPDGMGPAVRALSAGEGTLGGADRSEPPSEQRAAAS